MRQKKAFSGNKRNRVALIGAFGGNEPTTTGRTIRTRILYHELAQRYGRENVIRISTEVNSGLRLFLRTAIGVSRADIIMPFVSEGGMHLLFPFLGFLARHTGKKVYNSIIGGYIPTALRKYPRAVRGMQAFEVNWVQMPSMVSELKKAGLENAEFLPNAKPYKILDRKELNASRMRPLRVCTFSRVIRDKGIEEAIEAVKQVNEKGIPVGLDIYGEIYEGYRDTFRMLMRHAPVYVRYCGIVDYHKNVDVLKKYYLLLFPSVYIAEGFPGTLTDAFFSGTPAIATDWNYNGELLEHGRTGFLYDPEDTGQLAELLEYALQNPYLIEEMRLNCIREAQKYTYDIMIRQIFGKFDMAFSPEKQKEEASL